MPHVRQGDTVVVIAGKEKGKTGKVLRVFNKKQRVVVEGLMKVKRHTKPSQKNPQGGIVEREGSIHISNVALWSPTDRKAIKAGTKTNDAGKRVRFDKKTGGEITDPGMLRK
jgi:large subunit ribosomal protein L24